METEMKIAVIISPSNFSLLFLLLTVKRIVGNEIARVDQGRFTHNILGEGTIDDGRC